MKKIEVMSSNLNEENKEFIISEIYLYQDNKLQLLIKVPFLFSENGVIKNEFTAYYKKAALPIAFETAIAVTSRGIYYYYTDDLGSYLIKSTNDTENQARRILEFLGVGLRENQAIFINKVDIESFATDDPEFIKLNLDDNLSKIIEKLQKIIN